MSKVKNMKFIKMSEYRIGDVAFLINAERHVAVSALSEERIQVCWVDENGKVQFMNLTPRESRKMLRFVAHADERDKFGEFPPVEALYNYRHFDTVYVFKIGNDTLRGRIVEQFGMELKAMDCNDVKHDVLASQCIGRLSITEDKPLKYFSFYVPRKNKDIASLHVGFSVRAEGTPIGSCTISNNGEEIVIPEPSGDCNRTMAMEALQLFRNSVEEKLREHNVSAVHPLHLYKYLTIQYWERRYMTIDEALEDLRKLHGNLIPAAVYMKHEEVVDAA